MDQQEAPKKPLPQGLATWVMNTFSQCVRDRRVYEERWIEAKEQKEGTYHQASREGGSEVHVRSTRTKIKGTNARIMDVLFPGGSERNWKLKKSPKTELSPDARIEAMKAMAMEKLEQLQVDMEELAATTPPEQIEQMAQNGQLPDVQAWLMAAESGDISGLDLTKDEIDDAEKAIAKKRADRMSTEIEDQLGDKFVAECKRVVNSGNTYGTGWFKGPLAMQETETGWSQDEAGNWAVTEHPVLKPYFEFVPIWDCYPYPVDADSYDKAVGMFQRHAIPAHRLMELMTVPGVDVQAVSEHIKNNPHGDALTRQAYEDELKKDDVAATPNKRLYEMVEYTGYIAGHELAQYSDDLPEGMQVETGKEYKVVIWSLNTQVIRFALFPYDDKTLNIYHRYVYAEPEQGIYGEGVAEDNKDSELIFNAGLRGLINNMGKAQDAITEVNASRLHPTELGRAREIKAGDVVLTNGRNEESAYPAIRMHQIDTRINEFMAVIQLAKDVGEESTAQPRYSTHGANPKSGAAATAKGLGMLMTQADSVNKDPIANFDHGITKPFLNGMVHFNMQFSEDESIKGDYDVVALGSTALVAKEIQAQRLEAFAAGTANPLDAPWIKRGSVNRERAKALDLQESELVLTDEEYEEQQRKIAEQQAAAQQATQTPPGV